MKLKTYPDPVLQKRAVPLRSITDADLDKLRKMRDLMYELGGIGLAGPQVGWSSRVVVMDTDGRGEGERIFINPKIIESDGMAEDQEGCLSLPGIRSTVVRAEKVVVVAYAEDGKRLEIDAEGLQARAWQHEIDHLNGVLFIDKLPAAAQMNIRHRLKELSS